MGMVSRSFHQAKVQGALEQIAALEKRLAWRDNKIQLLKGDVRRLSGELQAIEAGKTKVYSADSKGNPKIYLV